MFFSLGWALGEHLEWAKYSNFRVATNVPLMIHVPGLTDNMDEHNFQTTQNGLVSDALVELVDLFPTLAELTGIGVPGRTILQQFCWHNMISILKNNQNFKFTKNWVAGFWDKGKMWTYKMAFIC